MKFLRYPGGKAKLLLFLSQHIPGNSEINGRYIEPFIGGGSVFLYLRPKRAIIADLNKELIDLYTGIRTYPHKVWDIFEHFPSGKEAYYKIRDEEIEHNPIYYRAARTLYLNRTCFKGMWRHNPKGVFNVGYGGEDRRWVITHDSLIELAGIFRKATIVQSDFEPILDQACKDDFIFLDPPYNPGEKEMKEAHYINGKFSFEDQIRLSRKLRKLSKKRVKWLMTNSSHPDICELYKGFNIVKIPKCTSRVIGVATHKANEVIISNYST